MEEAADQKEETTDDNTERKDNTNIIQPLTTMRGDLARLLRDKKISEGEISKWNRKFKDEALAYEKSGGDEEFIKKLNAFLDSGGAPTTQEHRTMGKGVDSLIENTSRDFLAEQIPKARARTEKLKTELSDKKEVAPLPAPNEPEIVFTRPTPTQSATLAPDKPEIAPVRVPIEEKKPEPIKEIPIEIQLKTEQTKLEHELAKFPTQEKDSDETIRKLEEQRERLLNFLDPLRAKEKELEEKEADIERERGQASDEKTRRELEERRWIVEDRRREIEQKRWNTDQEIIKIQTEIGTITEKKDALLGEKSLVEEKLATVKRKIEGQRAEKERAELIKKLDVVEKLKDPLELEFIALNEKRKKLSDTIAKLSREVESYKDKIKDVDFAERSAKTAREQHENEVERWATEEKVRAAEKRLWLLEDEILKLKEVVGLIKTKYQKILTVEDALHEKIKDLEVLALEASVHLSK